MLLDFQYTPTSHIVVLFGLVVLAAAFALLLMYLTLGRLWRRRFTAGLGLGSLSVILMLGAGVGGLLLSNMYVYKRFTAEQPVATLTFEQVGTQHYRVLVRQETGPAPEFDLLGDEWQLDARVIKWSGPALLLGLDTLYRLVRIQGRYRDVSQERQARRTVYSLGKETVFDLWPWVSGDTLPVDWVDALYGSSTFLPMVDGGRFSVHVTASGLIARPANSAAQQAVQNW